jgi:RNA recognition motif-containing protein
MPPPSFITSSSCMSKHVLYVGGLSKAVSDEQLKALFVQYGPVNRTWVIRHKASGKSAGYGFVEMNSGEEALSALSALEDALVNGDCLQLHSTPYVSLTA